MAIVAKIVKAGKYFSQILRKPRGKAKDKSLEKSILKKSRKLLRHVLIIPT
jgi:hypothetical protein